MFKEIILHWLALWQIAYSQMRKSHTVVNLFWERGYVRSKSTILEHLLICHVSNGLGGGFGTLYKFQGPKNIH